MVSYVVRERENNEIIRQVTHKMWIGMEWKEWQIETRKSDDQNDTGLSVPFCIVLTSRTMIMFHGN